MELNLMHLKNGRLADQSGIMDPPDGPAAAGDQNILRDQETVEKFVKRLRPDVPLFLFVHGGLVSHDSAVHQATRMREELKLGLDGKADHLFLVWETFPTEIIENKLKTFLNDVNDTQVALTFGDKLARMVKVIGRNVLKVYDGAKLASVTEADDTLTLDTLSIADDTIDHHQRALQVMKQLRNDEEFEQVARETPEADELAEVTGFTEDIPADVQAYADQLTNDKDASPEDVAGDVAALGGALGAFGDVLVVAYKVVRELVARRGAHDHGFNATLIEAVLRHAPGLSLASRAGQAIWDSIKDVAQQACASEGGVRVFLQAMKEEFSDGNYPPLVLAGHSAGTILLLRLLEAARELEMLQDLKPRLILLAPACRISEFDQAVKDNLVLPKYTRMFILHDEVERADAVLTGFVEGGSFAWLSVVTNELYPHSLLYLVAGLLEREQPGMPLLGLDRYLEAQLTAGGETLRFLETNTIRSLTPVDAPLGWAVTSRRHGGFPFDERMLTSLDYLRDPANWEDGNHDPRSPLFDPALIGFLNKLGDISTLSAKPTEAEVHRFLRPRLGREARERLDASDQIRRFIITDPVEEQRDGGLSSVASIAATLSSHGTETPTFLGNRVMNLTTLGSEVLRESNPHLRIQEDYACELTSVAFFGQMQPCAYQGAGVVSWPVTVTSQDEKPILARVLARLQTGEEFIAETDRETGKADLQLPPGHVSVVRLEVHPEKDYWPVCQEPSEIGSTHPVILAPLSPVPRLFRHASLNLRSLDGMEELTGKGVKVGVIDSGIGVHRDVIVSGAPKNFVNSNKPSDVVDQLGHGTHVAGIIGARGEVFKGYAPECDLYNLRAFDEEGRGFVSTVAPALKTAIGEDLDVVNMSFVLVGQIVSEERLLRDLVESAYQAGILLVAAVGNKSRTSAGVPASYPRVIGVSAVAQSATPAGRFPAEFKRRYPANAATGYYTPSFSNVGSGVDTTAPGICVVSTAIGGGFVAMTGTSMSAPQITGLAALLIEKHQNDPAFPPKGPARVDFILARLQELAVDLGLGVSYQGWGMPL